MAYWKMDVDRVSVEVLELPDRLEVLNVFRWDLCDFEQPNRALVVDEGTTLHIGLGLVGQLSKEFALRVDKVLQAIVLDHSCNSTKENFKFTFKILRSTSAPKLSTLLTNMYSLPASRSFSNKPELLRASKMSP